MRDVIRSSCPSPAALSRGLVLGEPHPLAQHIARCVACASEVAALENVLELARELPTAPEHDDVEERRTQLLAIAGVEKSSRTHKRGWRSGIAATAAAAMLVSWLATRPEPTQPSESTEPVATVATAPVAIHRGTVHADGNAHYSLVGTQPDEIVRLRDGTILIEVAPLHAGERFRVIVGDAEVEVRGTAFEVVASADHLSAVRVRHGRVDVRHGNHAAISLGAGDVWQEPRVPEPPPVVVRAPPRPPKVATPQPPAPVPSASDLAFQEGIAALRAGETKTAASAFERAIASNGGALVEDSRFWLAVARARSGQPTAAIRGFEDFLALHPRSARAGKASAMLGWVLLETNDLEGAKRRFDAAVTDPAPEVRASAAAGLDEVAQRRSSP